MKLKRLMKTAVKYGPIAYPIVKKALNKRKGSGKNDPAARPRPVDPKNR